LYFPNLKAAGARPTSTGTVVTDAGAVDHSCLDVFARNDAANPLFTSSVSAGTDNILAQDIHDAAAANINAVGGAFVAFGSGITIPAGTKRVQISSTLGEPVAVSFAANVGAAVASAKKVFMVQGGAPGTIDFIPGTENLIFIRSLSATAINDGYVAINFMG
jgi:hypothetical protein